MKMDNGVFSHYMLLLIDNVLYNKLLYFYTIFYMFFNRNREIQEMRGTKTSHFLNIMSEWPCFGSYL